MNRILFTSLLIVAAIVSMAVPAPAQTMSTIQKGAPLNAGETPITGFAAAATPTQTITSPAAVRMGTLPAGTVKVTVLASGAVNFGDSTVLCGDASTGYVSPGTIANGATKDFNIYPNTSQPEIYFRPVATGTTVYIKLLPHVQR